MVPFFIDPDGKPSTMRLMSFWALLVASVLALVPLWSGESPADNSTHVLLFLSAAFGGKVFQRFGETTTKKGKE